jgi:hypothetical protein
MGKRRADIRDSEPSRGDGVGGNGVKSALDSSLVTYHC